jgi:hypothetical protein
VIVRSKRPEAHYTVVQNEVIRDQRLSWRARGILIFLLSQPDNWKTTSAYLCSIGQEGRDSVRLAMTELEKHGYLARRKHQDERGRWTTATYVYDRPQNPQELSPPKPEYQASVNQALQEVTRKKDPLAKTGSKRKPVAPRICGNCDGAGWIPMGKGLGRCSCRGGIR